MCTIGELVVRMSPAAGSRSGTVTSMSLTYVSVLTDEGMLKVPNSSLLAAAVGPWDRTPHPPPEPAHSTSLPATGAPSRSRVQSGAR